MKEKWKSILRCIKNRNNPQFVQRVLEINKNDCLVDISHMGENNIDKHFYYIFLPESGNGFFAEFRKTLNALYFADLCGLIPIVEYSREFSYAEKEPVFGTTNPFEYYFEQPMNIGLEALKNSACVINYRAENNNVAEKLKPQGGYSMADRYEDALAQIIAKYIRPNRNINAMLKRDMNFFSNAEKILGVHVRGTDFKKEYNRHPNYVTTQEYLAAVKKIFAEGKYTKVFLATDDTDAVELFRQAYGDNLIIYQDVTRSNGEESVMLSTKQRENHKFLLGYEVLRDMYSLASCDGLVAGLSQVSICARMTKKSFGREYETLTILDKGIAQNKRKCIDDIEKVRRMSK